MRFLPAKLFLSLIFFLLLFSFFGCSKTQAAKYYNELYTIQGFAGELRSADEEGTVSRGPVSMINFDSAVNAINCHLAPCYITDKDGNIIFVSTPQGSTALEGVSSAIGMIYANPPASFALYLNDALANAGFVKPVHAQGIGFTGLLPLLPAWKTTRNISYVILIFVMVAIGFMVIFRMKIDPKTIISIQAALPKIVVTLVVITLSYAIVGFLIDLMYLMIGFIVNLFIQGFPHAFAGPMDTPTRITQAYMTGNLKSLFTQVFSAGFASLDDFIGGLWNIPYPSGPNPIQYLVTSSGFAVLIARALGTTGWTGLGPISVIISGLLLLILLLGLLFTFIRLLLILFNSYLQILINLILAPIILLGEAIPGKSTFGSWVVNILANLVVFPATAAVLLFAKSLTTLNITQRIWSPPLTIPTGDYQVFTAMMGLGVVFMAPNLVVSIKKMLHPKSAIPMTAATMLSPLTGSAQTAMGAASQFYYLKQMPVIGKIFGGGGHAQPGSPHG